MRVETGALQIGDDWTGLYIRGDDALMLRDILADVYRGMKIDEIHLDSVVYKYIRIIDCDVDVNYKAERDVQRVEVLETHD